MANTDDPSMPVNTFRAWFIGIVWAILIPGLNQFFFFRYPSVTVSGVRPSPTLRFPEHRLTAAIPLYRSLPS